MKISKSQKKIMNPFPSSLWTQVHENNSHNNFYTILKVLSYYIKFVILLGPWLRIAHNKFIKWIFYLKRFYLTLGHYPGHLICFHIKLGSLSFRGFPQFGNVAAKKR